MKLGKLCILFTDGDWIESKDQSDSGIRLIQTGNIGNGEFLYKNDKAKYISVDTFKRLNCKEVFPNDILVSRLPEPVGRGCIIPDIGEKMITAVDCTICRINENLVDRKYFCYFLESNAYKTQLEQHVTGTTRKRISRKNLSSVEIDIPEQAKQKEVVYKLDRLKKIIQNYNRELDLLDELVRARFVEMFGDVSMGLFNYQTCKLGDVAKVGSSHRVFTTEFVESGIPFYRGTEIGELANGKKPINPYYISEEHYKRLAEDETKPLIGDLLMPSICNKGQVWMVDSEEPFYYKDGRVLCISPNKEVFNSRFLQYFMREKTLVEYPKIGSGSTFAEFKIFLLKDMDVLVPPLELQNQFASFVEEIAKSRSRIQKSLEASQELFDSLMQEYFG